jgi:hypothetical protein
MRLQKRGVCAGSNENRKCSKPSKQAQRQKAYLRISNNIQQSNDIRSSRQVLQDLDLTLYLLLLDRLQHLDDTLLVVCDVDTLKDFRVLSAA